MRHLAFVALPLFLATVSSGAGPRPHAAPARAPVFSAALFAPLATANPDAQKRWSWPPPETFHRTWLEGERAARPVRLVRTRDAVYAFTPVGERRFEIHEVFGLSERGRAAAPPHVAEPWTTGGELAPGTITLTAGESRFTLDAEYVSPALPPTADAFADWIYVTTLLASDEPVYEHRERGATRSARGIDRAEWDELRADFSRDPKAGLARIERLLAADPAATDFGWPEAAELAATHDPELARRIYRVHRPVGQCSMDTRPAEVARRYAELCHSMADLGCYLQLSVQIMGNQFDRVAWGSYAEPVHVTHAEKLAESGLDVDRFLLGLATVYGTAKPRERELGPWRLARSIAESGRVATVRPELEKRAQDATLDEMNRFRATMVLAWIDEVPARHLTPEARAKLVTDRKTRFAALAKLGLSPISRAWVSGQIRDLEKN